MTWLSGWRALRGRVRRIEQATRPVHPETAAALRRRWAGLPASARTPEQLVGRHALGCEGTHGVFPACNLTCSPCYHSADANKVRVDGEHTLAEVSAQMGLLRSLRGPRGHAQLIGGEVTLLSPDDHAAALLAMRAAGREPMSMTHGDVDRAYLDALVTGPDGGLRLRRVSFAAHFDSLMRGRRGVPRPRAESDLEQHRRAFAEMFADLRRARGVRSFLAHNMTVTPANLGEVGSVVASVLEMGYSMMSFQPAASVGDSRRWSRGMSEVGIEQVWAQIERGLGQPVPWAGLQFGDPRCNRTAFGLRVGRRWVPFLDPTDPRDLHARDRALDRFGGVNFGGTPVPALVVKIVRVLTRHPGAVPVAGLWALRMLHRCGGPVPLVGAAARRRLGVMTFVVHNFMDAAVVRAAWDGMRRGDPVHDPEVVAAQERLAACVYHMAHPETGELVPACVQHSVLDPEENRRLAVALPRPGLRPGAAPLQAPAGRPGATSPHDSAPSDRRAGITTVTG